MAAKILGYARVSSKDQNIQRQIIALRENGVPEGNIFIDRQSGKDFARPAYRRMCKIAKSGDIVKIASVDRLGRCYAEVVEQWRYLTLKKGLFLSVLDMPLLDTQGDRDLTQRLISDLVLYLLSYVAEMERTFIRQRQKEGIAAARRRGVKFGAPRKSPPQEFRSIAEKWKREEISCRKAANELRVSRSTLLRWVHDADGAIE